MSGEQARRVLLVLWLGAVGIQVMNQMTYAYQQGQQGASQCTTAYLVPPHKFIAAGVVYSVLFGLAEWTPQLAVALGSAIDLYALLGPIVAGTGTGGTLFDKITGLVKASAA